MIKDHVTAAPPSGQGIADSGGSSRGASPVLHETAYQSGDRGRGERTPIRENRSRPESPKRSQDRVPIRLSGRLGPRSQPRVSAAESRQSTGGSRARLRLSHPGANRDLDRQLADMNERLQRLADRRADSQRPRGGQPSEPPFTVEIMEAPLPKSFRMPQFETYDGSTDPYDHLSAFETVMLLHGAEDAIMCRAFPATLKKAAHAWYTQLKPRSISSYAQLSTQFVSHFISSTRCPKTSASLMAIKQEKEESLREYLRRFNEEALEVRDLNQAVAVAAIIQGVRDNGFSISLAKTEPQSLTELFKRAEKYIRAEEMMAAKKKKGEEQEEESSQALKREERRPKYESYTPLNAPRSQILMEIKDEQYLKWPSRMRVEPTKQDRSKYCRFHRDHGHETDECRNLKDVIEDLIRQGRLGRLEQVPE